METYAGITPDLFWNLDDDEYDALRSHIERRQKEAEAMKKQATKASHG